MEAKRFTIYFTSDLHGYIYPTDYRSREERDMGLFKCASQFRKDGNTLVIDGGDILQGSPLGAFCHDTLGNASRFAEMMNRCGYDYVTLGNHDFNYGMAYLDSYLDTVFARTSGGTGRAFASPPGSTRWKTGCGSALSVSLPTM